MASLLSLAVMGWNLLFWLIICLPLNIFLLASIFCQILILKELEADCVNSFGASFRINYGASSRIDYFVGPEIIWQATLSTLILLTGRWFMILLTFPVTACHVMLCAKKQHFVDSTAVNAEKQYRIVKFALYLLTLLVVVFRIIAAGTILMHNFKSEDVRSTLSEF